MCQYHACGNGSDGKGAQGHVRVYDNKGTMGHKTDAMFAHVAMTDEYLRNQTCC